MRTIKSLSEVDYSQQEAIEFEATVIEVLYEGQEDAKRPLKVSLKLENSGEMVQAISWSYQLVQLLKDAQRSIDVISFEALSGVFSNKQQQIRIGNAKLTGKESTKKIIKTVNVLEIKREFNTLINKYIKTPIIVKMLETLVLNEPKFFEWPAATKLHHAFEGGLASHTLNVVKNAISFWENYNGESIDVEVIVAAAMLHDVGKLDEYKRDGERTAHGDLVGHLVSGAERVAEFCWKNGVDSNREVKLLIIKHIIISHHEKPEFGAAVKPGTLEALIVARADAMDAAFEGAQRELENLQNGQMSDRLMILDGGRVLKWK
jgi:3'-5' exoribonuclease